MKKRVLALALAVIMIVGMMPTFAFAAESVATLTLVADNTTPEVGDEITVSVKITATKGLYGLSANLDLPDGLSYVADSGALNTDTISAIGGDSGCVFVEANEQIWIENTNIPMVVEGIKELATFKCKVNATNGGTIGLKSISGMDSDFNSIESAVSVVGVELIAPHVHEKDAHTPAVAASCWKAGAVEYWTCTGCSEKLDTNAQVIADITVPATEEHVFGEFINTNADKHWKECTTDGCTAKSEEADHTFVWVIDTPATAVTPGEKHKECACGAKTALNTVIDPNTPDWIPEADATVIEVEDLTFAMNFKTKLPIDEQKKIDELAYYGDWEADFYLTVNKDVTFNANGTKDGYLAGQYDAWSANWVNVPLSDVKVKANQPFGILEYAASVVEQGGQTFGGVNYSEVVDRVKDFDCGVYFAPEFLVANPDLKVTLELVLSKEGKEDIVITKTEPFTYTAPALPTADVKEIVVDGLLTAMDFKATEEEASEYWGVWYADFVLTLTDLNDSNVTFNANDPNADGYLSGNYGTWGWVNVPFNPVTVDEGEPVRIMKVLSNLVGTDESTDIPYADICSKVKEFKCGVALTDEFLAANPNMKGTLELRLYNPADPTDYKTIGTPVTFGIPALPTATVTEETVEDLTFALNFKADEASDKQLAYYGDWVADFVLTVDKMTVESVIFNGNGSADAYLAGSYLAYNNGAWVKVPFSDVTVANGESVKIMQQLSNLMGSDEANIPYSFIYETVQAFKCGVFFSEEFLEANPDVEATLQLMITNPNADETYTIGEAFVFTIPVEDEPAPDRPDRPSADVKPAGKTEETEEPEEIVVVVTKPEIEDAEEKQAPVQLDMTPVNPNSLFGGVNTVNIKLPVYAGKVSVEIPVEDVTPGTVVVIVHEDGTEEIISTSVIGENGIIVELEGDVVVKVVDKSLYFSDVHGVDHWATKSVDFVTARGMFNGTSATTFSPENLTTRGQLMTVLARLSGADAPTIADGIEWAVENGISDGSNPDGYITRQDVAVMLWRYAGNIVSAYDISAYADAADVASYAKVAMAWAVENGIVTGYPDGTLLPQANATRAHVATMMERLVNYIA